MYSYSVSKHAVQGLTTGLKEYCKPLGIKVSNIVLDKVDTDFRENMRQYITISEKQKSCMIKASDVAKTVMYLLNTPRELLISSIELDAFLWE
ncbi:SDR family NAD(P)-dependent oxidoreductase [Snodgrassella gandavensis]|uniref:SDR family NAD(P)-dependent oxidoreductase n=1 Tax=Snodgrassella gandavensis TaxID=2946698 RepID=UPI003B8456CD